LAKKPVLASLPADEFREKSRNGDRCRPLVNRITINPKSLLCVPGAAWVEALCNRAFSDKATTALEKPASVGAPSIGPVDRPRRSVPSIGPCVPVTRLS
jgi:hypothetical protein